MKSKSLVALLCAFAVLAPLAQNAFGQGMGDHPGRRFPQRGWRLANLSEEERMKLRAAHQKAMQEPEVRAAHERLKQARREFREVMRPAMLRADPSVQAIFDKMRDMRP